MKPETEMTDSVLMQTATRYEDELSGSVMPFWQQHALDRECGGYFTCLDRDGAVYDSEKYMWMQWRIVYMFATLAGEPYGKPEWIDIARHGYDFLTEHGKDETGDYYFALNRQGVPAVAPYNIYSNCFAAMGAAALYAVTGDTACRDEAQAAMAGYMRRMQNPKGRWEKSMSGRPARRNLGHYMMLANLGRELGHCLGTDEYEPAIANAAKVVLDDFWDEERQVLFENVNPDGSVDLASCDGRHIIPGHGLESMWFLLLWAEERGDSETITRCCQVVAALLEFAWDAEHGGLYYFMDVLGRPHQELQWDMKLWWVHNEALIAALVAWQLSGEDRFAQWFQRLDEWTWRHFRDPDYGEWYGYLNRQGQPTHTLKGGKWKTCFHLPRYLQICANRLRSQATGVAP